MENNQVFTLFVVALLGLAGVTAATTYMINDNCSNLQSDLNDTNLRLNAAEELLDDLNTKIETANNELARLTTIANNAIAAANNAIDEARAAQAIADAADIAAANAIAAAQVAGMDAIEAKNAANSATASAALARANAIAAWDAADKAIADSEAAGLELAEMKDVVNLNTLMQKAETISSITISKIGDSRLLTDMDASAVPVTSDTMLATAALDAYTSASKALTVAKYIDSEYTNMYREFQGYAWNSYMNGGEPAIALTAFDGEYFLEDFEVMGMCVKEKDFSVNVPMMDTCDNAKAAADAFMGAYTAFANLGDSRMAYECLLGAAQAYMLLAANSNDSSLYAEANDALGLMEINVILESDLAQYYANCGFAAFGAAGLTSDAINAFEMAEKLGFSFGFSAALKKAVVSEAK